MQPGDGSVKCAREAYVDQVSKLTFDDTYVFTDTNGFPVKISTGEQSTHGDYARRETPRSWFHRSNGE